MDSASRLFGDNYRLQNVRDGESARCTNAVPSARTIVAPHEDV